MEELCVVDTDLFLRSVVVEQLAPSQRRFKETGAASSLQNSKENGLDYAWHLFQPPFSGKFLLIL